MVTDVTNQHDADVVVIGMGPGGEHAAGRLAEAGLEVIGIEAELVGGECPYWGCIPSKMMIRSANLLAEARRIPGMAGASQVTPDWTPVATRIRDEATDDWNDQVAVDRFTGKGGRFVRGCGVLAGPGAVTVDGTRLTARKGVIVATGIKAAIPHPDHRRLQHRRRGAPIPRHHRHLSGLGASGPRLRCPGLRPAICLPNSRGSRGAPRTRSRGAIRTRWLKRSCS